MECYVKWMTYSIFGATQSQHDDRIREVLGRLQKYNVTLKSNKCQFSAQEVKFLGQTINESGIRPNQDKVKAIIEMPELTDVSGICRFLGMINQLGKFIPHLAEITKPMDMDTRTAKVFCTAERKSDVSTSTSSVQCKQRDNTLCRCIFMRLRSCTTPETTRG